MLTLYGLARKIAFRSSHHDMHYVYYTNEFNNQLCTCFSHYVVYLRGVWKAPIPVKGNGTMTYKGGISD